MGSVAAAPMRIARHRVMLDAGSQQDGIALAAAGILVFSRTDIFQALSA